MACSFEFGNLEPGKGLMATTDSTKKILVANITIVTIDSSNLLVVSVIC